MPEIYVADCSGYSGENAKIAVLGSDHRHPHLPKDSRHGVEREEQTRESPVPGAVRRSAEKIASTVYFCLEIIKTPLRPGYGIAYRAGSLCSARALEPPSTHAASEKQLKALLRETLKSVNAQFQSGASASDTPVPPLPPHPPRRDSSSPAPTAPPSPETPRPPPTQPTSPRLSPANNPATKTSLPTRAPSSLPPSSPLPPLLPRPSSPP